MLVIKTTCDERTSPIPRTSESETERSVIRGRRQWLEIQQAIAKLAQLELPASRAQPGLGLIRVGDQPKLIAQFERDRRAHQRRLHREIQQPRRARLSEGALWGPRRRERKRGGPRLVHHETYFLLLLPLEEPRDRSTPSRRGFPCDLRVGIARLIFAQALEIAPVAGPRRLPRNHKRAVNPAAQNLMAPQPQIRLDSQWPRQIEPLPETPDSQARRSLDANARSSPKTAPKQRDLGRPRPEQDRSAASRLRSIRWTRPLKSQPLRFASHLNGGCALFGSRHNRHADFAAQSAPAGARESERNLNVLPFTSTKAFSRRQQDRRKFYPR